MSDFHPPAEFLLGLSWRNLFEPANASELAHLTYRCKGCGALLARKDRGKHHGRHKRQVFKRKEQETQRARVAALKKARAARERRAA
jgi:hypothetical protein